jgi:hypothetical protein
MKQNGMNIDMQFVGAFIFLGVLFACVSVAIISCSGFPSGLVTIFFSVLCFMIGICTFTINPNKQKLEKHKSIIDKATANGVLVKKLFCIRHNGYTKHTLKTEAIGDPYGDLVITDYCCDKCEITRLNKPIID